MAQLVGGGEGILEPRGLAILEVNGVPICEAAAAAVGGAIELDGGPVGSERSGQLRRNPIVDTATGETLDFRFGRAEGGLGEEARGVGGGDVGEGDGGRGGWRDEGAGAGALDKRALHFAGGIFGGVDADGDVAALDRGDEVGDGVGAGGDEVPLSPGDLTLG